MEIGQKIKISTDFSPFVAARYRSEGEWSGQKFLEELLEVKFDAAVSASKILLIDLDGVRGLPPSFVSGSFGKLSLKKGSDLVLHYICFKSEDNPIRAEKVIKEIKNPKKVDV